MTSVSPELADTLRDRYLFERELSRGGMATAYPARDVRHDRPVAVWRIVANAASSRRVRIGSAIFLFGWLGAALLLAPAPGSLAGRDAFYITPLIPLFALVPTIALLVALRLSSPLRRTLGITFHVPGLIRLAGESRVAVRPVARAVS